MVQRLRNCLALQRIWVRSLVRGLRSHVPGCNCWAQAQQWRARRPHKKIQCSQEEKNQLWLSTGVILSHKGLLALSGNIVINTVWRAVHHWYVVHKVQRCYSIFKNDIFGGLGVTCLPGKILVPQPRIEPAPLLVKAQSPNHWTTRDFPQKND